MERLMIDEVVDYCSGRLINRTSGYDFVDKVELDSREVDLNSLFVAIKGEVQDGHIYVKSAYENGCRNFIISDASYVEDLDANVIEVDNTEFALGRLSKSYRKRYDIPYVAVTGSVGKTTTRNMVHAVLSSHYKTIKNERNLNNQFGVPLTLFNLDKGCECAVIEMGMSGFGEIDYLAEIVRPNIAIISNIGSSHIERLGSREGILKAKTEIVNYFDKSSILVVNGEDDMLSRFYEENKDSEYRIFRFGRSEDFDIYYTDVEVIEKTKTRFMAYYRGEGYEFLIPTVGEHNVLDAVSAVLVGFLMGLSYSEIRGGLFGFVQTKDRQAIINTGVLTIINDVYNASPDSMVAALNVLGIDEGRKVAILGDCLEMGSFGEDGHRRVGKNALGNADVIITTGDFAVFIGKEAIKLGFNKDNVYHFDTKKELISNLDSLIKPNDTVLVKASRGCRFEEIVEKLEGGFKC